MLHAGSFSQSSSMALAIKPGSADSAKLAYMALCNDGLLPDGYLDSFRQGAKPVASARRWREMSELKVGEIVWGRKQAEEAKGRDEKTAELHIICARSRGPKKTATASDSKSTHRIPKGLSGLRSWHS